MKWEEGPRISRVQSVSCSFFLVMPSGNYMQEAEAVGIKGKIPPSKPGSETLAQAKTWEPVLDNEVQVDASKEFEKGAWILFV